VSKACEQRRGCLKEKGVPTASERKSLHHIVVPRSVLFSWNPNEAKVSPNERKSKVNNCDEESGSEFKPTNCSGGLPSKVVNVMSFVDNCIGLSESVDVPLSQTEAKVCSATLTTND